MGMIGTGSHTVVVEAQHIPAAWAFRLSRIRPAGLWTDVRCRRQQRLADPDICGRGATRTSRRALDAVADLVRAKAGKAGSVLLIDNAHVQRLLMGAEAALPVPLVIWLLGGQGNSLTAGGIGSLDTVVMSRMPEGRGVCLAAL